MENFLSRPGGRPRVGLFPGELFRRTADELSRIAPIVDMLSVFVLLALARAFAFQFWPDIVDCVLATPGSNFKVAGELVVDSLLRHV